MSKQLNERAETAIRALSEGLPDERHYQARKLFEHIMLKINFDLQGDDFRDERGEALKSTLPMARRIIGTVHPASVTELGDAIVAFYESNPVTEETAAFYNTFEDPVCERLADLTTKFVVDWEAEHKA